MQTSQTKGKMRKRIYLDHTGESIHLADLFNFIADFETETGFGLSDIYNWLSPDITEPEKGHKGYLWGDAEADYQAFQSKSRSRAQKSHKTIPVEIANAFFSVCENFKIYAGERAQHIHALIYKPVLTDVIPSKEFKPVLEKERERTDISDHIIWKLLPDEVSSYYPLFTYADNLKERSVESRFLSKELATAILEVYSKIPGKSQPIDVKEGVTIPPFGSKHSFSVSREVACDDLNTKINEAIKNGCYKSKNDFVRTASYVLQADVEKIFEKHREVAPRLRVAICLALLEGHEIPQEVLDVHRALFESSGAFKSKHKPAPIAELVNI